MTLVKKDKQLVLVILNAAMSGALMGFGLMIFGLNMLNKSVGYNIVGFLLFYLLVGGILWISTSYYLKMK